MATADTVVASVTVPDVYPPKNCQKDQHGRVAHIEGFFDLGPREVHPWHKAAMPTQEQLQQSTNAPVIVTPNPMVKQQVGGKRVAGSSCDA